MLLTFSILQHSHVSVNTSGMRHNTLDPYRDRVLARVKMLQDLGYDLALS